MVFDFEKPVTIRVILSIRLTSPAYNEDARKELDVMIKVHKQQENGVRD
jgi:hypothetical protein